MNYIFPFIKRLYTFSGRILYLNIIGMAFISILEGIGIFLLIPLINISGIVNLSGGRSPISKIFVFLHEFPISLGLSIILFIYVLLMIGQNLLQRNLTIRNVSIIQGFIHHLRIETYRLLLRANWSLFIRKRKSDLINHFTSDIARVTVGINLFLQSVTSLIFTFIQIGFAFWLSANMTIFVLLFGIAIAFFSRRFIRKSNQLGNKTSILAQEYLAGITDQLNGIKDIKSNNIEESRLEWLRSLTQNMFVEQIEYIKLKTSSQLFYKISSSILISMFIYISIRMFHAKPEQFLLIIAIFSRLWPQITNLQSSIEQIASTIPAFKSLFNLQEECKKETELKEENFIKHDNQIKVEKGIECRNVYFKYNLNEPHHALKDINLYIQSNQMTAVVGPSGAGKSTLIDIIMGLNRPESGQVLVDGTPIESNNLFSLRQLISYVPQDPFLFNTSIRENLLMIKPDVAEEEIWEALEFSCAAEFVSRLPNGLDTLIGDRGIRLSGGERQRLVLARAILKKPFILVLDEATSALDTENEAKIQEAIEKIKGTMTIIVIAHRLSTIRHADQVVVLNQGKIIQIGEFSQLAKENRGMFSNLLERQLEVSG